MNKPTDQFHRFLEDFGRARQPRRGARTAPKSSTAANTDTQPVPRARWPKLAKAAALLANGTDAGVGDTVERVVGPVGGDAYKAWYLIVTGQPCGCGERKEALNRRYPYNQDQEQKVTTE